MTEQDEALAGVVEEVCNLFLGLRLRLVGGRVSAVEGQAVRASVTMAGGWSGALVIECRPGTARDLAAALFQVDRAALGVGEIEDALGEVVNVLAGGFKALLPAPCSLSLPSVAIGRGGGGDPGFVVAERRVVYALEGQPFVVSALVSAPTV